VLLQDFTFYDGTTLPAGTCIAICTHSAHFSDANYTDPLTFDPLRFVKLKAVNPEKQYGIISTSGEFLPFGLGRHACPGRYFAASELKLMLAYVVKNYDVKLEQGDGSRPKDLWLMGGCLPNQNAKVFFRKRSM
jgi:cytochrome P450